MERNLISVDDLVNNSDIGFSDSEGMIEEKRTDGEISCEEHDELFYSMNSPETKQKVLDWKLEECDVAFINSIKRIGIASPIGMVHGDVMNGHHRIAVAQHLGIKVPIDVYESFEDFEFHHKWDVKGLVDSFGGVAEETL